VIAVLRFAGALALLCLLPFPILAAAAAIALCDLAWWIFGRRRPRLDSAPDNAAATVVIPNWNGRDLLEKYLPSVIEAMRGNPRNEILVVDNGSDDGSADFVRRRFPEVRLLALEKNLGFGGGANAGFRAASNDIVVLLNSDMRVAPDFLAPLLAPFADPQVFAVSCQILFTDPKKPREETGLTQGWWEDGAFRVRHRLDNRVDRVFPCFYPGGGSSAFDRRKFFELGGFDQLLRPFYGEDTDLGYLAWKRGWKVFYQPQSLVWHEHRGTIGKKFSPAYIESILQKNFVLLVWKNIHEPARIAQHLLFAFGGAAVSLFAGPSRERYSLAGLARACLQLGGAMASRWRARSLAAIDDTEALRRPLAGFFHDRFAAAASNDRPRVLFVSPYPIEPPVHGGGVFMSQTIRELAPRVDLHVIALLDRDDQAPPHEPLRRICASVECLARSADYDHAWGSTRPHAVREFFLRDLEWLIHRQIYLREIDVLQFEYANMGQYAEGFRRLVTCVFEHDVYFQTVGRLLRQRNGILPTARAALEYVRALPWELKMLRRVDRIQVCTQENRDYLVSFAPQLAPKIDTGLRAGIQVSRYRFHVQPREPWTMLFLGSFRHLPNQHALTWFLNHVLPLVLRTHPSARLRIVGSDPPPRHVLPPLGGAIEVVGFVPDVRAELERAAVFVCPIQSGSGVRVKLLEAFASGIPCVSTYVGAEGLARRDGEFCLLADSPEGFAKRVVELFEKPHADMVARARREVEEHWDMAAITARLAESYRAARQAKGVSRLQPEIPRWASSAP
jgi:GT2 family glycosyltransferase/glycosyltransferase involved in cell wall biosynthesis